MGRKSKKKSQPKAQKTQEPSTGNLTSAVPSSASTSTNTNRLAIPNSSDLSEKELEALFLQKLDLIYKKSIKFFSSTGFTESQIFEILLAGGLISGPHDDPLANILCNATRSLHTCCRCSPHSSFSDLHELQERSLESAVTELRLRCPELSRCEALWRLLESDLSVRAAVGEDVAIRSVPCVCGFVVAGYTSQFETRSDCKDYQETADTRSEENTEESVEIDSKTKRSTENKALESQEPVEIDRSITKDQGRTETIVGEKSSDFFDDCSDQGLFFFTVCSLHGIYNEVISKLLSIGIDRGQVERSVLSNGHFYKGSMCGFYNIMRNANEFLHYCDHRRAACSSFPDIDRLVEHDLDIAVDAIGRLHPELTDRQISKRLILSDFNLMAACNFEDACNMKFDEYSRRMNRTILDCEKVNQEPAAKSSEVLPEIEVAELEESLSEIRIELKKSEEGTDAIERRFEELGEEVAAFNREFQLVRMIREAEKGRGEIREKLKAGKREEAARLKLEKQRKKEHDKVEARLRRKHEKVESMIVEIQQKWDDAARKEVEATSTEEQTPKEPPITLLKEVLRTQEELAINITRRYEVLLKMELYLQSLEDDLDTVRELDNLRVLMASSYFDDVRSDESIKFSEKFLKLLEVLTTELAKFS